MTTIIKDINKRKKNFALKHNKVHLTLVDDALVLRDKNFEGTSTLREDARTVNDMVDNMGYLWQQAQIYKKLETDLEDHLTNLSDMEFDIEEKAAEIGIPKEDILPDEWEYHKVFYQELFDECQYILDAMRVEFQWRDL